MLTFLRCFLVALLTISIGQPTIARAQTLPTVRLAFDKTFYNRTESFTATGTITNPSGETLRYARLTLSIFPAAKPGTALSKAFDKPLPPIIRQSWFKTITPEPTVVSLTRSLPTSRLNEGVYPAELSLSLASRQTLVDRTFLVVLDPKDRQMPVAVVWNLHQPERRLPSGVFVDDMLAGLVAGEPDNQGLLTRQLSVLAEQPTIKTNLSVSPLLLEQLSAMAAGYRWREEKATRTASRDSEAARAAQGWLDALKKTIAGGQAEVLTAPYGQAPLPVLAKLGWEDDARGQIREAKAVSRKTLALDKPPRGFYLPGLWLDRQSAEWLAEAGAKYAVASVNAPSGESTIGPLPRLDFAAGGRRLTIIQSDPEIIGWLHTAAPEKAGADLTAILAQRVLTGAGDNFVTIAPDDPRSLPSPELLREIYSALAKTPWIKTVNLSSLADLPGTRAKLAQAPATAVADPAYARKLARSRQDLSDFAAAVAPASELRQRLERQLYTAESIDYLLGHDGQVPPIGEINADSVRRTIDAEFAKLDLAPPSKITFSTKNGKVPVAIINRTGYPMKVRLRLTGKEFVFSDDKEDVVTLMPKENLISHNITAGFVGLSKLNIAILAGDRVIESQSVEVRVSNLLRYLVVGLTTLSILGVASVVFIRGKRR